MFTFCFIGRSYAQNPIVQDLLNNVNTDSILSFALHLTGGKPVLINGIQDTIKSRHHSQPGNEKAFQYIKAEWLRYGYIVDSLEFSINGKNLYAIKPGYRYPNQVFMLGAHYDNYPGTEIAPGADDNASGTAAVLEAARVFSTYSFPYTIVFAVWDEEEIGLLGSKAYCDKFDSDTDTLIGYINMDMIAWDGNNDRKAELHIRDIGHSYGLGYKARNANTLYSIGLDLVTVDPGSNATDHQAFWEKGFSAIGLSEQYEDDFNPFYHSVSDSVVKFNQPYFVSIAKLAYATLADCLLDSVQTLKTKEIRFPLRIYPNPCSDKLNVDLPMAEEGVFTLHNTLGTQIFNFSINSKRLLITLPDHLANGVYVFRIQMNSGRLYTGTILRSEGW